MNTPPFIQPRQQAVCPGVYVRLDGLLPIGATFGPSLLHGSGGSVQPEDRTAAALCLFPLCGFQGHMATWFTLFNGRGGT